MLATSKRQWHATWKTTTLPKKTQHGKEWRQHDRGRAASLSLTAKAEDVVLVKIVLSPVLIGRVISITEVTQPYCEPKRKREISHRLLWESLFLRLGAQKAFGEVLTSAALRHQVVLHFRHRARCGHLLGSFP